MPRLPTSALVASPLLLVIGLVGLRLALEPAESPVPMVDLSPSARERLAALAQASEVPAARLGDELARVDVLLVGEEHFYQETVRFLIDLLEAVETRRVYLLLELPSGMQAHVEEWVTRGASPALAAAIADGDALPYGEILSWAHRNPHRLSRVVAMDEDRARIVVNRALLRDTRNETMARAVLAARAERPADLVVAYGGQMHMLLSGRYRYDREDRTPAGARILQAGVPRARIRSVLLSGSERAPINAMWPGPGALAMSAPIGQEAWPYFIDYPVFRATSGRDLFDVFVDLGPLTRAAR